MLSHRDYVFWLLAVNNLLVGGMVGLERTVVPLLGTEVFGLGAGVALGAFVISFGVSKALFNLFAGALADRLGRKGVLVAGWLIALPIPFALIWAPSWAWVVAANVLLGVSQALTWSMTVNMMVDLVPRTRRGFAAGVNEFAGYAGVSLLAFFTGVVAAAYGLRPEPFYLGFGVVAFGLALALVVPETAPRPRAMPLGWVRGIGALSALGAATNLKDGLVWLALPLMLAARGFSLVEIGLIAGLYPLLWAGGQLLFGPLSDRWGRAGLVRGGMLVQGGGLLLLAAAASYEAALTAAVLMGLGTGMVYPTLIAAVADQAPEAERATALGLYRFFRDGGYALGATVAVLGAGFGAAVGGTGLLLVVLIAWLWRRVGPERAEAEAR